MTTKSFIKSIGEKGLLADYNTVGKKLQTELTFDAEPTAGSNNPVTSDGIKTAISNSVDQTYSSTSTKAQSGVAVNEAFKTRETSRSDDSYTYLGMIWSGSSTEKLYWKLVSFKPLNNYWTLQFEIDVCNGRNGNRSFDTEIYETKRLTIYSGNKNTVENAIELRYTSQSNNDLRGYGNNIYYAIDSSGTVTIYIYAAKSANKSQICRLTCVRNAQNISNITWYEPVDDAGTQPSNPIKFKEAFPAIASPSSNIGSDSVPVYINKGKPVSCNSSNLKAGKDDDGNVIKNTYQKKLIAGDNITIGGNTISADSQIFYVAYGSSTYDEVRKAYDAGKAVFCIDESGAGDYVLRSVGQTLIAFVRMQVVDSLPTINELYLRNNDQWSKGSNIICQKKLTFDAAPTAGSNNPVTSDGIKTALDSRIPAPTSTTGTQVLKCINGVIQWVTE